MIWDSVFVMTLIDLVIVAMAGAMLFVAARGRVLGRHSPAVLCLVAGVTVVGTFYLADLLIMHAGPALLGGSRAMQLMESLHLEAAWIVTPVLVGLLFGALLNVIRETRRSDRTISLLSDVMPVAICYVDAEQKLRFANSLCAKWRQRPVEEMLGQSIRDLMDAETYSVLTPYMKDALAGHDVGFESVINVEYSKLPRDIQLRLVPDLTTRGDVKGFYAFMTDVTEQNQLEREVVAAGERERNSIGRDLHDNLGQTLTGASLKLQALARRLRGVDSEDQAMVSELQHTIQMSIEDTRNLARLLAPAFDKGGLEASLQSLATEAARLFGVQCEFDCGDTCVVLNPETSTHVFRIVQESLTNAVRHGNARGVYVKCRTNKNHCRIEILDDGVGIGRTGGEPGMGIHTMRYRARMIGGDLRVEPAEQGGTRVVCNFPVDGPDAQQPAPEETLSADTTSEAPVPQAAVAQG